MSATPYAAGYGCPKPKTCVDSSDLRCCLDLKNTSPVDKLMKSCCANSRFADKDKICPCSERPAGLVDYPHCCDSAFDANKCCTTKEEYTGTYKDKCCDKNFDVTYCCDNGDFSTLLKSQKEKCCNNEFNAKNCCSV